MGKSSVSGTIRWSLAAVAVVVPVLFLFWLGLVLPGKTLPTVSLSAEEIPLPFALPLFGHSIPNTLPATWLTMGVLIGLGIAYNVSERRGTSFHTAVDALLDVIYGLGRNVAGPNMARFFPMIATLFFFILASNWLGLLPGFNSIGVWETTETGERELIPFLRPADAHLSTTLALALISVAATQYYGLCGLGIPYLSRFFNTRCQPRQLPTGAGVGQRFANSLASVVERGANLLVGLLELIGELIKVMSFSFRLFGNTLGGDVLLIVISFLAAFVAPLPFFALELFVGAIQALIFAGLSLVFFQMAVRKHGD